LLLGLLFSSTGSFRNELETGAFELLLVTPIREAQIILGRVWGIWRQFLPAFVIYGAGVLFLGSGWTDKSTGKAAMDSIMRFALLFFSAPFIGLYFSL
jgi:ABC-type transport system involved in cytochrome c biogenesis permease component